MAVTLAAVFLFFTGLPLELVALGAAAVLLLGRTKPEKVYREIDWSLLVMFTGLFIVVHAFQVHVVSKWGIDGWDWLLERPVDLMSLVSAGLSNLVSNVPAVLLMEPVLEAVPEASRETAWLALAMSSTFAGNLTVLGSVANLIVVENARREGVTLSFWEYCKVGIPLTILTLALGIAWLQFVHYSVVGRQRRPGLALPGGRRHRRPVRDRAARVAARSGRAGSRPGRKRWPD